MASVVDGIGAVSAFGHSVDALRDAVLARRTGIRRGARFRGTRYESIPAAFVDGRQDDSTPETELTHAFALEAAVSALLDAGLSVAEFAAARAALVVGTSLGDAGAPHRVTQRLAGALSFRGPALTISTACTSSTWAVACADDWLRAGAFDLVLAGGTDALSHAMIAGFDALGVLSDAPCTPYGHRVGTSLGEGAGFVVLRRRARVPGDVVVIGHGSSGDAFHDTSPDPRGAGVERALRRALADASVGDVAYANLHGTGTRASDPAEAAASDRVLGSAQVSSTKGAIGHAQGAAGILEWIVSIACARVGRVPPNVGDASTRRGAPRNLALEAGPIGGGPRVKLSSAFGGNHCALVFGDGDPPARVRRAVRVGRPVRLREDASGRVSIDDRRDLPRIDTRTFDPSARFLTAVVRDVLLDDGVLPPPAERDDVGLFVSTTRPSPASTARFLAGLSDANVPSASAFARVVLHAAAGSASAALAIKGPMATVSTGGGGDLVALVRAVEHLRMRRDGGVAVAACVEERAADEPDVVEGAAAVVVSSRDGDSGRCVVLGTGWAGPRATADAASRARRDAGYELGPCVEWCATDQGPGIHESGSYHALDRALAAFEGGDPTPRLLVVDTPTAAVALLLGPP